MVSHLKIGAIIHLIVDVPQLDLEFPVVLIEARGESIFYNFVPAEDRTLLLEVVDEST